MFQYQISCKNLASQYLQIHLQIPVTFPGKVKLQLPIWRAGRYFPSNYAQNIRNFSVRFEDQSIIPFYKKDKSLWVFEAEKLGKYEVSYEFFAGNMDAGSAWVDEQQVYLNLVNCCMEVFGTRPFGYQFKFKLPHRIRVCTLPEKNGDLYYASNFQEVADSTLLASKEITHWKFSIENLLFHCWIHGEIHFDQKNFLDSLKKIAISMIRDFGEFPEKEYHFILELLPYEHYHGVEHRRGTVITYGAAETLKQKNHLLQLIGVCSHELYHAWNVCRIRPKAILPYDFSKENYTIDGWILEGITSYMGDLYLLKAGVISLAEYLEKLQKTIQRVSEDFGWRNSSILDSSFDTWVDGYHQSAPDRKQNIYANGALIALAIDLKLTSQGSSLSEIMKKAWIRFGKNNRGYSSHSFWRIVAKETQILEVEGFYNQYITGKNSILPFLMENLPIIGIELKENFGNDSIRNEMGILQKESIIKKIHPDSFAYQILMIGDKISSLSKDGALEISRINGSTHHIRIKKSNLRFFPDYQLLIEDPTPEREHWMS
ncbi:MAG: M61 family peptidase [Algoriphagus sp.]|uniref:M61 family metallopeptidase n=1 Tax=Algoriphagus sp. TaxID=1872435 RepID=UPI001854EC68|nr:M61 family peptidase [Algoriphagus sp.]NVJ87586.1 M61 family peptidase [Algoriphagus sp.]